MSDTERPYWHPELADADYFARLRKDYPEYAHLSDEGLGEYFEVRGKYADTWDHAGDAYNDYEPLADDWFRLREALKKIRDEPISNLSISFVMRDVARAALDTEGGGDE